MTDTPRILERNGCPLHYWLTGREGAPLIVLTHGATLDHRMFDAQVAALALDYRVLTWDMRGHGRSQPMGGPFSVPDSVDDLLALLDAIEADTAVFVGQSTGGYVVQELVFRHPERVTALVMIDCTCLTFKMSLVERITLGLTPYLFLLYPYALLKRQTAQQSSIKPEVQAYIADAIGTIQKHDFITIWTGIARCLHYEQGYSIKQPILLVRGDHDKLGNIAKIAPQWAARDPDCQLVTIPDAGHCSNQDNPALFNETLMAFLGRQFGAR